VAVGAAFGVAAGAAVFLAVSHSGAVPSASKGTAGAPAVTSPAPTAPSVGGSSAKPAPSGSSTSSSSGSPSSGAPDAASTGHASAAVTASAAPAASPASGDGAERAHLTSFSITADGFSSSDTIDFGDSAALAESGIPGSSGTVTFADGGTTFCVEDLATDTSCDTAPTLAIGVYTVTGTYSGDGSTSTNTVTLTVDAAGTSTTSVTDSQNDEPYGTPIGFTIFVDPTDGGGTVSLFADGSATAITGCADLTLTQVAGGSSSYRVFRPHVGGIAHVGSDGEYTASCSPTSLPAGTHTITAVYTGDPGNSPFEGSSGDLSGDQTVTPLAVDDVASGGTMTYGGPLPVITPSYFTLQNGDTVASFSTPDTCSPGVTDTTLVGDYPSAATCSGAADPNYTFDDIAGDVTVNPAPTSFSITADGSSTSDTIDFGSTALLAESGLPGGAAGTVTFASGGTTLCTATLPAETSCTTDPSLAVADYPNVTGTFNDTDGNYDGSTSTNTTLDLTVEITPTTTVVGSSGTPSAFGNPITFTATVSANDGGGSVAFSADGNPISGCASQSLTPSGSSEQATCVTSTLPFGTHAITAVYSGDAGYETSTNSPAFSQDVSLTATSFTITVNSGSSATIDFGSTATLAESGLPVGATGSIAYSSGGTPLCTATVPSGSCTTSASLAAGDYSSVAGVFTDTDGNYAGSTSTNTVDLTVDLVPTTTTVTSNVPSPTFGQSVTFTATVSPDDAGGTVAFSADGTVIGGCGAETLTAVSGNGKATCATAALTAGSHSITAVYSGDAGYATSTNSPAFSQTVNQAATSFTITVNSGSSATIDFGSTATLAESGLPGGVATGTVTFASGGIPLCTATLPLTSCTTSASLPVGTYATTKGTFADTDGNYTGSVSTNAVTLTVSTVPTTTTVMSGTNPSTYGNSVTFTAAVSAPDGGGTVAFAAGGTTITGCGSQPLVSVSGVFEATCSTSALSGGGHTIAATYAGDTDYAPSSGTLSGGQTVDKAGTSLTITVNSGSSATIDFGSTATLAETGLPGGATGTVTFASGGTPLCTATLPLTSCTTSASLAVGDYSATQGSYGGDGNYAASTSNTVDLTVVAVPTTTTVTSGTNPSTYGNSVTFTAAVAATDGGGTVAFSSDATVIAGCGAQPLASVSGTFKATCSTSALGAGSHAITALYSGDAGYATSNGTLAGGQTVNQPTLTITASNASIAFGTTPPAITPSYSGFKNGDTFHSLTTAPTCTTPANSSSPVSGSPYVSSCSGAVDPNYAFAYVNGTVSVTRASTSFSSQLNGFTTPQTVEFGTTATLSESGLPAGATGTVTYSAGGSPLCVITLPATSCDTSGSLAIDGYSPITGTFADTDGNYTGSSSTNTLSLTVVPVPGAPVAVNDSYSTGVGETLDVGAPGVLGNDTLNGGTIVSNTDPADGTLTLDADGSFTYVPNAMFNGDDSFSYTLRNGVSTASATVTIDVSNAGPASTPSPDQVFGQNAIDTSVAISQEGFPTGDSAGAVVLARSDYFADALSGGPLAAHVGGPLLLTPGAPISSTLDAGVQAEISRVLAPGGTVYVLGGDLAISGHVDSTLSGLGYHVVRLAGKDEYATAVDVAEQMGNPSTIFEATGLSFYDALSAVPAAIEDHGAILLTDGATQAPETAAYLAAHPGDTRYAIGGPLAAYGADPSATPVYGADQYATSAAIAVHFFPDAVTFGAATADDFQDALGGGVFMGTRGHAGPMLLVNEAAPLPTAVAQYLGTLQKGALGYVFGGPMAISAEVVSDLQSAVGGAPPGGGRPGAGAGETREGGTVAGSGLVGFGAIDPASPPPRG
jgi:large repetitive protein